MSHIVTITTKITDLAALRAACKDLGFEFVEGQKTYEWFGKWIGDTPMPAGMAKDDLGKCEHAIKVPGATYEVGVARTAGGYALRWDYWSSGGLLDPLGGQKAGRLVHAYSRQKSLREAARLGHRVIGEQRLANGAVKLVLAGRSR